MKHKLALLLGLLVPTTAFATDPDAVDKTEASMQVAGEVVIAADGTLQSYTIDNSKALPIEVKNLVARYLRACEFAVTTASGKPGPVTADMSLLVLARPNGKDRSIITVNGAQFTDPDTPDYITSVNMEPPRYPMEALRWGLSGTVYVVLRLNPDGSVAEAHAEQVNMTVLAGEKVLERGRTQLSKVALAQARQWRFKVDPALFAEEGLVDVRVPVDFKLGLPSNRKSNDYGKWQGYVPGPYQVIPWRPNSVAEQGLGALPAGKLYPLDARIKLRNPPTGS